MTRASLMIVALLAAQASAAQNPIVIRAGTIIDGHGRVQRDMAIVIFSGSLCAKNCRLSVSS